MKLDDFRFKMNSSNAPVEEQYFSIEDQGMIFDILRNKMYSDPINAICREISCNARDAHREVGTPNLPIHVYLPNNNEPYFKVKDFGPGISPDRIANIYIKYTASTKRSDNVQTGGFGLGAKTPFAYSDSFTIVTNYNGIQYNYLCFIDETKVGKITLLGDSKTSEANGTEIIVPVRPEDFENFRRSLKIATNYWEVKPVVKGASIDYIQGKIEYKGDTWAIAGNYDYSKKIRAIVDGIEYPIDDLSLKSYCKSEIIDSVRGSILLYFNVGELSLSANREQIYLDQNTKNKIASSFLTMSSDLRDLVSNNIKNYTNLWEAVLYFNKLYTNFNSLNFLGNVYWQDLLINQIFNRLKTNMPNKVHNFYKHFPYRSGFKSKSTYMVKRSVSNYVELSENCALFFNDLKIEEPSSKIFRLYFENNPDIKRIVLLSDKDISENFYNDYISLNKMSPILLSSITTPPKKIKSSGARMIVYKLDNTFHSFTQVKYDSIKDDNNKKVICLLDKINDTVIINNKVRLLTKEFSALVSDIDSYSFYGVDKSVSHEKIKENFTNFEEPYSLIKDVLSKYSFDDFCKIKFFQKMNYSHNAYYQSRFDYYSSNTNNKNSLFLKKINIDNFINQTSNNLSKDNQYLNFYELIVRKITDSDLESWMQSNPDYNIKKIEADISKKYPLLDYISSYTKDSCYKHICDYVNLIDKEDSYE